MRAVWPPPQDRWRRPQAASRELGASLLALVNVFVLCACALLVWGGQTPRGSFGLRSPAPTGAAAAAGPSLRLSMRAKAIQVEVVDPRAPTAARTFVARGTGEGAALAEALGALDARHPNLARLELLAEPKVAYEDVVATLDRLRRLSPRWTADVTLGAL